MSRLRKVIASRMVESLQISAQLTATVEVDMTAISRIRNAEKAAFKAREGVGLSYLPFITKPSLKPSRPIRPSTQISTPRRGRLPTVLLRTSASPLIPRAGCWFRSSRTLVISISLGWPTRLAISLPAPATTR
ncbi:dihydrolipoamide acyltransferase [Cutibacterium acnes JCM 18916]|nr:dihydrolipoamide acyltransferase [Cutibacterium acnes JCM 18916]